MAFRVVGIKTESIYDGSVAEFAIIKESILNGISRGDWVSVNQSVCCVISQIQQHATEGDCESQFVLGVCYAMGFADLCVDNCTASYWILKAAQNGYTPAQEKAVEIYLRGIGVAKSHKEAIKWMEIMAKAGNIKQARILAVLYRDGCEQLEIERDFQKMGYWIQVAYDNGDESVSTLIILAAYYMTRLTRDESATKKVEVIINKLSQINDEEAQAKAKTFRSVLDTHNSIFSKYGL